MLVLLCLFIFIALFAYLVIYAKNYAILLEPYTNKDNIYDSVFIRRYLNNIHYKQYGNKLSNFNWNINNKALKKIRFKQLYMKSIVDIDNKYLPMLAEYVKRIKIIISKCGLKNLNKYKWNMVKSINNLEDSMPYTLDKFIVINESMLENNYNYYEKFGIDYNFLETLIHEQLHVIQRQKQEKFNGFYRKHYKFLDRKITIEKLPDNIRAKYMTNPDSNFDLWIYKINNKLYYPILEKKNSQYQDMGYNVLNNRPLNLLRNKQQLGFKSNISFYHPNEIFACYMADRIVNNNVVGKYSDFMKSF
jgi:hypothetical protein